jgi:hypothetical protein
MLSEVIREHLVMSLLPCLIGMIVGGSLGALGAVSSHRFFLRHPRWHQPAALTPWRTLLAGLLLVVWSPCAVDYWGAGPAAGAWIVGIISLLFGSGVGLVVLFEYWHPSPPVANLIAGARTLFILAIVFGVEVGYLGGGGLGSFIMVQKVSMRLNTALTGWGILTGIIFLLDLLLGLAQMAAAIRFTAKTAKQ